MSLAFASAMITAIDGYKNQHSKKLDHLKIYWESTVTILIAWLQNVSKCPSVEKKNFNAQFLVKSIHKRHTT